VTRRPRTARRLAEYARKRDFERSPEPRESAGEDARAGAGLRFVVQQHAARRMHFDFRLEWDGVLKSWAVPKGPHLDPREKRMAVEVEDHPLAYADFEGVIPQGEYGGGAVSIWDRGHWTPLGDAERGLVDGKLDFTLAGKKLHGRWHLVRMRPRARDRGKRTWLLIKGADDAARSGEQAEVTAREPRSVESGRALAAIARAADREWRGGRAEAAPRPLAELPAHVRRAALPRVLAPQLATLVDAPPAGDDWLHELKLDGYRVLARLERGRAQLVTRSGKDWTQAFAGVAAALARLPVQTALLDGEVVALDAAGRSDFQRLQRALKSGREPLTYYAFDLLHLEGYDLRGAPQLERKRALAELLARAPGASGVRLSEHTAGDGAAFLRAACGAGAEGVVSKRASAPYRGARTRAWVKVKCGRRQEFVIVGFTAPKGTRVAFGALLLGVYDDAGALQYVGKVGTGFDGALLASLGAQLRARVRARPPVANARDAQRDATWVAPELVAEVSFTEWTADGRVRHPAFVALRADKPAREIRRERPEPAPDSGPQQRSRPGRARPRTTAPEPALRGEVAGVRLSHPERVYYPDLGVTKSEIAQYYEAMAERALPGLRARPLSLVRCPDGIEGECFYQKQAGVSVPARVGRVAVNKGKAPYAMVTDLASLISLVQIGALELHVWGARADDLERPDLLVLDLDPDPSVPWARLAEAAQRVRRKLSGLGFVPFLRTTGGKGLHVVAPLVRRSGWPELKAFAYGIALQLVRETPKELTAEIAKAKRHGKILIDYLRNQREATAVASYSLRARPGAPVATPIAWSELEGARELPRWSLRSVRERLGQPDPWQAFEASRRALTASARARVDVRR
jgi:bifunctional non-homologous end joining protein LigD